MLVHIWIDEHRTTADRTRNFERLVRLTGDGVIALLEFDFTSSVRQPLDQTFECGMSTEGRDHSSSSQRYFHFIVMSDGDLDVRERHRPLVP